MEKLMKLKFALVEKGLSQRGLARKAKINPAIISLGINGRFVFDEVQKRKICKALEMPYRELFDD